MTEKDAFFKEYAHCATRDVLKKIWEAKMTKAFELDLTQLNIIDLAPLENLVDLTALRVSWTDVSDLSPLVNLTQLTTLYIYRTKISDLSPLSRLHHLSWVSAHSTPISNLSPLSNLSQLLLLDISHTKVSDLSPLSNLSQLTALEASFTKISNLSPLEGLTNLEELSITGTLISDLSPVSNLSNLTRIDISHTSIIDLSPLSKLERLILLEICNTQVEDLSPLRTLIEKGRSVRWQNFKSSVAGGGIFIQNCNNLKIPPIHIAKRGNESILHWFEEQRRSGTTRLYEARLLIVGQGGAGKTTLRRKLLDSASELPPPDLTTRGIEIESLTFKHGDGPEFHLHIWDFGGQNIQHYAHQFFLSEDAVYALLHSEREQNDHTSYWLNTIEMLGKDSPLLIVQNEKHGHSGELKDPAAIRERFANVRNFVKLDLSKAETDKRFKEMKQEICLLASCLPHVGSEYLTSFEGVRRDLQELAAEKQHIPFSEFEALCDKQGIRDTKLMRDYAWMFHRLGIALWFGHDDIRLENRVFLRPKWIIDALFELLYEGKSTRQKPVITAEDTRNIWADAEYRGMHSHLLDLMERFEMCYNIPGTRQYMIPQLLPARKEIFEAPKDATRVLYRYKFLPKGFLTRLTCRLHHRIAPNKVWSDAVVLVQGEAEAFVREVYADNTIEIIASGPGKADLLNQAVDSLDNIHASTQFGNLQVEKLVPCPCSMCMQYPEKQHFFDYDYLRRKLRKGDNRAECGHSLDNVFIRDILREVRLFSLETIRDLLAAGRTYEALHLLRGKYPDESEVVLQMSRLNRLDRTDRIGSLSRSEYTKEESLIVKGVLHTLEKLEV